MLTHWKTQAPKFLKKFAKEVEDSQVPASNRREDFVRGMVNEFVEGGCSENGTRLKFACAQVCADLEELIDGLPFGAISQQCTGPGSRAGFSVFEERASKNRHLGSASSQWEKNPIHVCFNPLSSCATPQNTNLGPSNTPFPTG